jgi:hypothetical protein
LTGDNGDEWWITWSDLGFGWIEKKDLQSNKLTRTEYSQTYPYTGQTTATKEYIEANNTRQLLNEQINSCRIYKWWCFVHRWRCQ